MRTGSPSVLPRAARYRHVVFPDPPPPFDGVVDYGPRQRLPAPRVAHPSPLPASRSSHHRSPHSSQSPLDAEEHAFLAWLFDRAGLDVSRYKSETLRRRLPACLRAIRATSLSHARGLLEGTPRLRRAAVTAVVIGVTHFFRDPQVFSRLAVGPLSDLLTRRLREGPDGHNGRIRVWSAGCSDGAELYSVAILLAELDLLDRCDLLGTDCRPDAVDRARAGEFDDHAVRTVPPDLLRRYFTRDGADSGRPWRVAPALRALVQWRTADVLSVREPGSWDLVLCRNLSIYLQPRASTELWRQLEAAVRPGGVLVLGKAERPGCTRRFAPLGPCLYRRSGVSDVP